MTVYKVQPSSAFFKCEFLRKMPGGDVRCVDGGCAECNYGTHERRFVATAEGKRLCVTDCCAYCERIVVCTGELTACAKFV